MESLSYGYFDSDNVRSRDDLILGTNETFEYDSLNRLHVWNYTGAPGVGAWRIRYPYEDSGNLKGRVVEMGVGNSLTFNYGEAGHGGGPHALTSTDVGSYSYDPMGQQISAPGRPMIAYNNNGLPSLIQRDDGRQVRYSFGGLGRRVRKTDSTGATTAYVDRYYEHRETPGTSQEIFNIFAEGRKIGEISGSNGGAATIQYLHEDGLGSIVAVTDQNGSQAEAQRHAYDPFGRRFDYQTSPLVDFGSTSSTQTGFTGQNEDSDVGLVNLNARLYDPRVGRFVSPDPIVGRPLDGQSFNRYSYTRNNPLTWTDPSGLLDCDPNAPYCPGGSGDATISPIQGDKAGWKQAGKWAAKWGGWASLTNTMTLPFGLYEHGGDIWGGVKSVWKDIFGGSSAPSNPWNQTRPADLQGVGTGDAPPSAKTATQGGNAYDPGVARGITWNEMYGADAQAAIGSMKGYERLGDAENAHIERSIALDLARRGLDSPYPLVYNSAVPGYGRTPMDLRRSEVGDQAFSSAQMLRSTARHELDGHARQQLEGRYGESGTLLRIRNENEAMRIELRAARDSGLSPLELGQVQSAYGNWQKALQYGTEDWPRLLGR